MLSIFTNQLELFDVHFLRLRSLWLSTGTSASSTTKTGRHDIVESGVNTPKINI
jgi:hypothetical protein